jgi:hypothetical protein
MGSKTNGKEQVTPKGKEMGQLLNMEAHGESRGTATTKRVEKPKKKKNYIGCQIYMCPVMRVDTQSGTLLFGRTKEKAQIRRGVLQRTRLRRNSEIGEGAQE